MPHTTRFQLRFNHSKNERRSDSGTLEEGYQPGIASATERCRPLHILRRLTTIAVHKDCFSFSLHVLLRTYFEPLYKTIESLFEVADGFIRLTMLHSFIDTMLDMLFQDCFAHLI